MVNKLHENVDLYDNTFGEPTTEVVTIQGVIDFLDNVIEFTNKYTTVQEDLNNKYYLKRNTKEFDIDNIYKD